MEEYNIDLVIDKTFHVFANNIEEAKEEAILRARQMLGAYNSLSVDNVEKIEED